jgi:hypothetical protein
MKHKIWIVVSTMALLLAAQSAWAVRVSGGSPSNVSPAPATVATPTTSELSGIISTIDYPNRTINIGGVTYQFSAMSVLVHSSDPLVSGNPLRLQKGMRIKFTVTKENGKTTDKVTEIWVQDNHQ